ncbi:ATP-binding protein [Desulfovibrio inopinatus]|uniref:ATP-binding protein n=1 Tax=Desulfovibrio inopinatus TaxID=102109 RepID=UPI00040227EA|nr:ATP-binding protein [Desulfovibrio inopinatus]
MPQASFSSQKQSPPTELNRGFFGKLVHLLPQSIYLRFLLAALVIGLLTSAVAIFASWWISRSMIHTLRDENMVTILRNTVDLIGRTRISMDEMRSFAIDEKKRTAEDSTFFIVHLLETFDEHVQSGTMQPEEARHAAFQQIQEMTTWLDPQIVLVSAGGSVLLHPQSELIGKDAAEFRDKYGESLFVVQNSATSLHFPGSRHYHVFQLEQKNGKTVPVLVANTRYSPWDLWIFTITPLDGIEKGLNDHFQTALNELRARIQEIVIAKTGYVFVFNEQCHWVAHPNIIGGDYVTLSTTSLYKDMCQSLKDTAERPFGKNILSYDWEKPDERNTFTHSKIAWCVREPITGWYVCVSAYTEEVNAGLPQLIASISMPALGSIVLVGLALALLLRSLLRPIADLTNLCQSVSRGNLDTKVDEDAPGEMGYLCRQFNKMVFRLRALRQKDEIKRRELEELNTNLGKLVRVRTQALERKARKLEDANQRLRALDEMKSSFVSSVSHELRTPLTSILGFAKIILKDFRREYLNSPGSKPPSKRASRIASNLDIIIVEGERLTRLVNDFLDLAKIESGRMQWHDTVVDMSEVFERSTASIMSLAEQRHLAVRVTMPNDIPPLYIDRDKAMQIFVNLLHNAVKFTPRGSICIHGSCSDDWVQFVVTDTGVGMTKSNLSMIFDKFQQAVQQGNTLIEKPKGTGLGLAICKNIIDHYGGLIWAESEPDKGTSIYVELPAMRDRTVRRESICGQEETDLPQ